MRPLTHLTLAAVTTVVPMMALASVARADSPAQFDLREQSRVAPIRLAQATATTAQNQPSPSSVSAGEELEEITVTGSRISRDRYSTPTPVMVLEASQLAMAAPSNIADGLNQLPQFANSRSQNQSQQLSIDLPDAGNYLNLRGVGPVRSLVLLDGRRVPPTSFEGTVDVNTLPQMLVERVDVVTAGVSSVYGADAVAGVVNYVLDTDFEGLKGTAQVGQSSYGDGDSYKAGLAGGTSLLDDRLHLLFSAEHSDSDGVGRKGDRPEWDNGYLIVGAGTAANPYYTIENARLRSVAYAGLVRTGPLTGQTFTPSGEMVPFNMGTSTPSSGFQIGGDGAYWGGGVLTGSLRTNNIFARLSYDITPDVTAFVQAGYGEARNVYDAHYNFTLGNGITIFSGNAYLPTAAQDVLTDTGTESFRMNRMHKDFGSVKSTSDNESLNITAGVGGSLFSSDWKWNAYFTHGESKLHGAVSNSYQTANLAAALDAVRDTSGNIVCRVTITNPGLYPGCVPVNIFGEGAPSDAAKAYIVGTMDYVVRNDLDEVGVDFRGSPFSTWAGEVSMAIGANYREQSLTQVSNSDPSVPLEVTGIRGVTSAERFGAGNMGVADGSYDVKEVFLEAGVPLLSDVPLAQGLELNGAVRSTEYSTSGSETTWKLGLTYQPFNDLRLRVTKSEDIRAPTLYDLFAGTSVGIAGVTDQLTGTTDITGEIGGGNPGLKAERGETFTYGFIYQPSWLPGLALSVDYYDLEITDAISTVALQTVLDVCYNSGGTDPLCALITRPISSTDTSPANFPTGISTSPVNIATIQTKGIDIDALYAFDFERIPGKFSMRVYANYLDSYQTNNGAGALTREFAGIVGAPGASPGIGYPEWRGALSLTYTMGSFTAFVQERYIDAMSRRGGNTPTVVFSDGAGQIPAVYYTDVTLEYKAPVWGADFYLSVNNLFDERPPIVASVNYNPGVLYPTAQGVYDVIGAYYTAGVRFKF